MTGEESGSERRDPREGRGRLSSIEMLPEICDEDIAWANAELRERKMPQTEILREFNARIADHGIAPISKSAFSRYSVRCAIEMRKLSASRQITDAVLTRLEPGNRSDSTIAAVELLKHRIIELVMDGQDPGAAALALNRLSTIAAREKEVQRRDAKQAREDEKREREEDERSKAELAEEVGRIATEAGLGADRIAAIRKGVLGLSV